RPALLLHQLPPDHRGVDTDRGPPGGEQRRSAGSTGEAGEHHRRAAAPERQGLPAHHGRSESRHSQAERGLRSQDARREAEDAEVEPARPKRHHRAARGFGRVRRPGRDRGHRDGRTAAQRDRCAGELGGAMAIVTPGKRPCDRIAQSKVLEKKFNRGKRGVYAGLTLTSLVDVMTIIVIFLLMNFSANGEVLYMSKDIKLPDAYHGSQLDRAPVISVSPEAVTFDGRMLLNTADLAKGDALNVPELEDALRDEKRRYETVHQNDPDHPFRGLINVQADKQIPFKVIKRVMFACNQSGFGNINFAALSREA